MQQQEIIPHLFRTEFGKITSVLCSVFGLSHIEVAEDIASETFLAALESWPYNGVPPNPAAWLYATARNKTKNYLARNRVFAEKIAPDIKYTTDQPEVMDIDLSEKNITDSQLRMLFAICHPALAPEAQIGLALKTLCGLGIEEIGNALLTSKETINKRLYRAKEQLRTGGIKIEFPGATEINNRLNNVLTTLYLLFSEGYYSESKDTIVRNDLCMEAMRLTHMLIANEQTNLPPINALLALMCFQASRFAARSSDDGAAILYYDQDSTAWNRELIEKGAYYLHQAAQGATVSKYHLEAGIAYYHTQQEDTQEKWQQILLLFDQLVQIDSSPVAALNRVYALAKVYGKQSAIAEAEQLKLSDNQYYFTLLGELYTTIDNGKAKVCYEQAFALAKTTKDRAVIREKIERI